MSEEADLELMRFHLTHSQTNSPAKRRHVLDLLDSARTVLLAENELLRLRVIQLQAELDAPRGNSTTTNRIVLSVND
jgi:hypothetical protein